MKNLLLLLLTCLISAGLSAQTRTLVEGQRTELGKVSWLRDYDEALAEANRTNKPVLILFQEVPGCATCQRYGTSTLSHPLMVEAIENEFVPLAIFNNKGGKDAKTLTRYNEPAWNNPVVRIVDAQGKDLVDRVAGNYSPQGLFAAIERVITTEGGELPGYLRALRLELSAGETNTKDAYFQMYCFWSGEHHLGNHEGVLTTEPGFMGGHEVVKLSYDPTEVSPEELARYAATKDIKPVPEKSGYRTATKDHFYQLQQTDFVYLPLTDVQKTKMNSAYGRGQDLLQYLSPRQRAFYAKVRHGEVKKEKLYQLDFAAAWEKMKDQLASRK